MRYDRIGENILDGHSVIGALAGVLYLILKVLWRIVRELENWKPHHHDLRSSGTVVTLRS